MKYLLDTNLLLRMVNSTDPHHSIAMQAFDVLLARGDGVALVPQVFYEFWVVSTRPANKNGLGYTPQAAAQTVDNWLQTLKFVPDDPAIFPIWLDLVNHYSISGKPAHDARLVAAMIHHKIDRLLTFNDADFKRFTEITAESPLALRSP